MIDYAQNPEYLEFANSVLSVKYLPDPNRTAWITKLIDGAVAAVVIYTNVTVHNCEMVIATDGKARWATREFLGVCYRYAFKQMKLKRITVVVDENNHKSLKLCEKLGHTKEGLLLNWFGSKNGIAMRMLDTECKWIQEKQIV